ncbi:MAG: tyrosinase family protein [Planctomycetes bacterium]|nr:tyrosinase family protein [Planctomycetota bacterium]
MFHVSRWLIVGLAAISVLLLPGPARAQHIRHDARSADGQKMLKIYAKAVAKMKATKEGDPDSWTFQWYTHNVKGPSGTTAQNKAAEIMRIYGAPPSANKSLALDMWNTCQAHGGQNENYFLPWHRAYIYYLEEIIRDVSGEKSFTLPYWNYSVAGANHGVLPPEFRMKNDPLFKSLYIENRNPGVNAGGSIDSSPTGLSTIALEECFYQPTGGGTHQGFNMRLDFGLHGHVHVTTGDGMNMGSVQYAARDPIFYLHHCNIDRLWASWNKAGRKNSPPAPLPTVNWTFAEKKAKVIAKVNDWMVPETEKHGYCYDHYEAVPKCPTTFNLHLVAVAKQLRVANVKNKDIKLGAAHTHVKVETLAVKEGAKPVAFKERVKMLAQDKHLILVLKNLKADVQPGVIYNVYLELPEGAKGDKAKPHFVGHINFFGAVPHGDHGHEKVDPNAPERFRSFDITALARQLHAKNLLHEHVTVTIGPAGQPAEKSNPVIGEIHIIEH